MGLIYVDLKLSNPKRSDLQPVEAEALVDTGSVYLFIPEHVRLQLTLVASMTKEVTLADGSRRSIPYVGLIETCFKNRLAYVGAIVMGDEVLLGAIPMTVAIRFIGELPRAELSVILQTSPDYRIKCHHLKGRRSPTQLFLSASLGSKAILYEW